MTSASRTKVRRRWLAAAHAAGQAPLECVAGNPGATVQTDVLDYLPKLARTYRTLVSWIDKRARAKDAPIPRIVFTTYPNPLPADGARCPDTEYLDPEQVEYLSKLIGTLSRRIRSTIEAIDDPDVALADLTNAYDKEGVSHRWCSDDPWAYGLAKNRHVVETLMNYLYEQGLAKQKLRIEELFAPNTLNL